jgi:protein tyrosine phosphatase (PTP) superfamily phosphohydrolase (DUF442 family)
MFHRHAIPPDRAWTGVLSQLGSLPLPEPGVDADFNWVVPGLAVGGQPSRQQTHRLHKLGIGAVLSLRSEDDCEDNPGWARHAGLRYQRVTVPDGVEISQEAMQELTQIGGEWRRQGLGVLVHCQAGRRRGPIGAAAILVTEGWDVEDALRQIRRARRQFAPTPDQLHSLRQFAIHKAPLRWAAGRVQQMAGFLIRSRA